MERLIAHVDADSFYVAVERVMHPELNNQPVAVLSSLDAFVISRSYDLKALGIKVGTSKWDAQKIAPETVFIPANFAYYGKVSQQMLDVMQTISPQVEAYSIDEAYLDLTGLDQYYQKSPEDLGDLIKKRILESIGIVVSVGIGKTKTLAKLASDYQKPNGLFVVNEDNLRHFLCDRPIDEICGIGPRWGEKLKQIGWETAWDFYQQPLPTVMKMMGKHGVDLWFELHGTAVSPVRVDSAEPKSISRTANFELKTRDRDVLFAALTHHTEKIVAMLVERNLFTKQVSIFLRKQDFSADFSTQKLPYPTNNYALIIRAVRNNFEGLYQTKTLYRGTGVITEITPSDGMNYDLFVPYEQEHKAKVLTETITKINEKFGRGTIKHLSTMLVPRRQERNTPERLRFAIIKAS